MPLLSRCFVRSALLYLGIGFTIGGLILSAKGGAVEPSVWLWLPAHIAILLNGWLVQLALGVAYWIMPRIHEGERGRRAWAWGAFVLMQIGLLLTVLSGIRIWLPELNQLFAPAFCIQAIGVMLFAVHAAPRIRPAFINAGAVSR